MKPKVDYTEGTCFAVPLRAGGYALGLVARMDGDGRVFGYFFGPKVNDVNVLVAADSLTPEDAALAGKFGDLGLIKGAWPVVGRLKGCSRAAWPMPLFFSEGRTPDEVVLAEYDEDTLNTKVTKRVPREDAAGRDFLPDRLMGSGSVEIRLTRLLR